MTTTQGIASRLRTRPTEALLQAGRRIGLRVDRQFLAGIDLVSSSAIGALVGIMFWLAAARGFDEATVGVNSALVSTMMLVAGTASLGLPNALVRFIPAFGAQAKTLMIRSYLVSGVLTAVLGIAVGIGLGIFYEELTLLRSTVGVLLFAAACVAWQIFVLQDSMLVAIGRTRVVPIENAVFSIAKLVALVAMISLLPTWGIFAAWVGPVVLIIAAVNIVIFRHFRAVGDGDAAEASELLGTSDLIRFSIGEHAATLLWMGAIGVLPLVVLGRLGDEANAFYAMAWSIAYNLFLVSTNIGTALLAEAAQKPQLLQQQRTTALRQMALLVVPGALGLFIVAPLLLRVFGGTYSSESLIVLRLLALAAIAHLPVAVFMAAARAERRMRALFIVVTTEVGLVALITAVTIDRFGVTGVGLAWLSAEVLLGIGLLFTDLRPAFMTVWRSGVAALRRTKLLRGDRLVWAGALVFAIEALLVALTGLSRVSTELLSDLGLISAVPPLTIGATFVVIVTAVLAIERPFLEERWPAGHVAVLVTLLSAAPSVAYETVRYPWAFKHIGVTDFILRTGGVDRGIDVLDVYHNWPGFFSSYASIVSLAGLQDAIGLAVWAPLTFNLMTLLALAFVIRQLSSSRRVVWSTCLLFFLTNWIGQDYFAPQALALVLYLFIIGTVLRLYRRHRSVEPSAIVHGALVLATVALVSSHQLTPFFLLASLTGLALIRQISYRLPLMVGVVLAAWITIGAFPFLAENLPKYIDTLGSPSENAAGSFGLAAERSDGQAVVAMAGRLLLVGLGIVASFGAFQLFRRPQRDLAPFVLLAAPAGGLFLAFGGEILFRVVLFMLPMLSFFAASALASIDNRKLRVGATMSLASLALVPFSFAYYGKDSFYTFSDDEVTLVGELSREAPNGSLLIEGTRNYPAQYVDYEKFVYVPIAQEPTASVARVESDPANELYGWMTGTDYPAAYVLLTDGQRAETEAVGSLPATMLPEIEEVLRDDSRFVVHMENDSGVVFTLAVEE